MDGGTYDNIMIAVAVWKNVQRIRNGDTHLGRQAVHYRVHSMKVRSKHWYPTEEAAIAAFERSK